MPTHQELHKLSDEHKAVLAKKCVYLLMGLREEKMKKRDTSPSVDLAESSSTAELEAAFRKAEAERTRPRAGSHSRRNRSILAAPPLCIPEVQETTHAKRLKAKG